MKATKKLRGRAGQSGMTLIEIMVVVLIIGMIVMAVGGNVFNIFGQSKVQQAETEIANMKGVIKLWAENNNGLPDELEQVSASGMLQNVEKGEVPTDPWKRPYQYEKDESYDDGFLLWSLGNKQDDETDDIRSDKVNK